MKITLSKPVQFGSETVSELVFREATARDFRELPMEPRIGDFLNVAARLCGQVPAVMDMLSPSDMSEVIAVVGKSWAPGQGTGEQD